MSTGSLGALAAALHEAGLEPQFQQLKEIIWLAEAMKRPLLPERPAPATRAAADVAVRPADRQPPIARVSQTVPPAASIMAPSASPSPGRDTENTGAAYGLATVSAQQAAATRARRTRLRGISPLPQALRIARAMKPLSRRQPLGDLRLDERATAEFIAESGLRIPVLKRAMEHLFEVVLAVEEVPSLAAWQPMVNELEQVLRRQCGFRSVTRMTLNDDGSAVSLRPGWFGSGRHRILLVVSDATSQAWQQGRIGVWLQQMQALGPLALVQLLPQLLWPNTTVGFAEYSVSALRPGASNTELLRRAPPWASDDDQGVLLPVVSLQPASAALWARMVAAAGNAWSAAALVPIQPQHDSETEDAPESPEARVQQFMIRATPEAQRLAAYLAAVKPLTAPVMRVIQHAMDAGSETHALAQVLLGGLLYAVKVAPGHVEQTEFDFYDGVRDLLERSLSRTDQARIQLAIWHFIQSESGVGFDFFALMEDGRGVDVLPEAARPFAQHWRTRAAAERRSPSGRTEEAPALPLDAPARGAALVRLAAAISAIAAAHSEQNAWSRPSPESCFLVVHQDQELRMLLARAASEAFSSALVETVTSLQDARRRLGPAMLRHCAGVLLSSASPVAVGAGESAVEREQATRAFLRELKLQQPDAGVIVVTARADLEWAAFVAGFERAALMQLGPDFWQQLADCLRALVQPHAIDRIDRPLSAEQNTGLRISSDLAEPVRPEDALVEIHLRSDAPATYRISAGGALRFEEAGLFSLQPGTRQWAQLTYRNPGQPDLVAPRVDLLVHDQDTIRFRTILGEARQLVGQNLSVRITVDNRELADLAIEGLSEGWQPADRWALLYPFSRSVRVRTAVRERRSEGLSCLIIRGSSEAGELGLAGRRYRVDRASPGREFRFWARQPPLLARWHEIHCDDLRTSHPAEVVLEALSERSWDIVHLAGTFLAPGTSDPNGASFVLDARAEQVLGMSSLLRALGRPVPLLFIGGALGAQHLHALAEYGSGVLGFRFLLPDLLQSLFVRRFYRSLLAGSSGAEGHLGRACLAARKALARREPHAAPWLSAVLYEPSSYSPIS